MKKFITFLLVFLLIVSHITIAEEPTATIPEEIEFFIPEETELLRVAAPPDDVTPTPSPVAETPTPSQSTRESTMFRLFLRCNVRGLPLASKSAGY